MMVSMFLMVAIRIMNQKWSRTGPGLLLLGALCADGKSLANLHAAHALSKDDSKLLPGCIDQCSAGEDGPLPVGLINLRNTCYMNAILQCLYHVKEFSTTISRACTFKEGSVGAELQTLFNNMRLKDSDSGMLAVSPLSLAMKLKINIANQEDAEELMLKIINDVDESTIKMHGEKASKRMASATAYRLRPSASLRMELDQLIYIPAHRHLSSNKQVTNFDMSVQIQGFSTLESAIADHFAPEPISGYKCATYGVQDAEKSLRVTHFPRVLAMHLKRFSYDPLSQTMKKVVDPMNIPTQLNLREYAAPNSPSLSDATAGMFELRGVVVHEGSLEFGHYYAYVKIPSYRKNSISGQLELDSDRYHWVKCNDKVVSVVTEDEVLTVARGIRKATTKTMFQRVMERDTSTNAYMLFYTQLD